MVGAQGAPPTQGISPMTYPWAKQGHRPAWGFWSASSWLLIMVALKKRTVRRSSTRSQSINVFILTQAIYSISPILFVFLFFRVFFVDYSLQIKQRENQSQPLRWSTMIPLSNTHYFCQRVIVPWKYLTSSA